MDEAVTVCADPHAGTRRPDDADIVRGEAVARRERLQASAGHAREPVAAEPQRAVRIFGNRPDVAAREAVCRRGRRGAAARRADGPFAAGPDPQVAVAIDAD